MTNEEVIKNLNQISKMYGHKWQKEPQAILISEALSMAIEALEKQIPKKPYYEGDGYDEDGEMVYDIWRCPNCDEKYEYDYDIYDYCPNCGQAIDWEEGEQNG